MVTVMGSVALPTTDWIGLEALVKLMSSCPEAKVGVAVKSEAALDGRRAQKDIGAADAEHGRVKVDGQVRAAHPRVSGAVGERAHQHGNRDNPGVGG